LTGRWSAMARPSVFSGNNRKRNICARNATRSLPLSLLPRPPLASLPILLHSALSAPCLSTTSPSRLRLTLPTTLLGCKARTVSVVKFVFSRNGWEAIGCQSWNDILYVISRYLMLSNSKCIMLYILYIIYYNFIILVENLLFIFF